MSTDAVLPAPDSTAIRVALWRALHVAVDAAPHVLTDEIGLKLADAPADWRSRPDMDPGFTAPFRASIVARARFIDDLVAEQVKSGVRQYVLLGAGLDTFAQRRPDIASQMTVFEIDRPAPLAWKRQRLAELGYGAPDWLRFVPVDFESGQAWPDLLEAAGFDRRKPALIASTGVSMYLTHEANLATLRQVAGMAQGTVFAMTFLSPIEDAEPAARPGLEMSARGAKASGTPFISFYRPADMLRLAGEAGFSDARHVGGDDLTRLYFAGRPDGLRPLNNAEELLVATV